MDRLANNGTQPVDHLVGYLHRVVEFGLWFPVLGEGRKVLLERRLQTSNEQKVLNDIRRLEESFQKIDFALEIGERNVCEYAHDPRFVAVFGTFKCPIEDRNFRVADSPPERSARFPCPLTVILYRHVGKVLQYARLDRIGALANACTNDAAGDDVGKHRRTVMIANAGGYASTHSWRNSQSILLFVAAASTISVTSSRYWFMTS